MSETHVDVLCFGDTNGSIDLTVSGGSSPYTYDWDNDGTGDNDDTEDLSSLGAGMYNVTVTDASSCQAILSVSVSEPSQIALSAAVTNEIAGQNDGAINLTVTGGTPPYTYDWDNDGTGDNDDTEDLSGLSTGPYAVVVTDANGCTATLTDTVGVNTSGIDELAKLNFTLYPNPSAGLVTIKFEQLPSNGVINVMTTDGKNILTKSVNNEVMDIDLSSVAKGVYIIEIVSEENRIPTRVIIQ